VSYRVVSADSHPVAGALTFAVGAGAPSVSAAPPSVAQAPGWPVANVVNRLILYASLLASAGGVLYLAAVARFEALSAGRARKTIVGCALAALASAALSLALKGGDLAPGTSLLAAESWRLGASTSLGRSVALMASGLIVMIAGLATARVAGPWLAVIGALAALAALGLTGHAAEGFGAGPALVVLHGAVAAFWMGSLWQLFALLRAASPAEARLAVERFSRFATLLVPLLIAAGATLAWRQLGSLDALLDPGYGRLLVAKLALVAALLGLALYNKAILTPRLLRDAGTAARALRRAIAAEGALAVAILGLTATLGHVAPPRATRLDHAVHHHPESGFAAEARVGERIVRLAVSPAQVGRNVIAVAVTTFSGAAADVPEVTVDLEHAAAGIAPIERTARRSAPGRFELVGPELSVRGEWQIQVRVRLDDFTRISAPFGVEVR
jgi:copper transport protein